MILVLAQPGTEAVGKKIADSLQSAYQLPSAPAVLTPDAVWNQPVEWDDLLVVVFSSGTFPDFGREYIHRYKEAHTVGGPIVPVSTDPAYKVPPDPVSGIHAAQYDGTGSSLEAITRAVGVFLGLALRPGSNEIFVSYRVKDGDPLAKDLCARLEAAGFKPWLDTAKENVPIGDDVQEDIRKAVQRAAMVLLVDTPSAPDSDWVTIEVDLAIAQLLPVLPVVAGGEPTSRFIQLQSLRRQSLVKQNGLDSAPLSDLEWAAVLNQIEEVLLSAYRRRLLLVNRAQVAFVSHGFNWQVLDDRLRMYKAGKPQALLPPLIVLSHCSVHDITYGPALDAFWNYVRAYNANPPLNARIYIYDRDRVLSKAEIATIDNNHPNVSAILVHHNELDLLLSSGFTKLRDD